MSDGKILIMGVGGCGSGFIWNMFRLCGVETTTHREWIRHGGIRSSKDPANFPAPKVIKHLGGFMANLQLHMERYQWEIEHVFFATAKLELAMSIQKVRLKGPYDYDEQLALYHSRLGKGTAQLIETAFPFTVVRCPDSILHPEYLYEKMRKCLPGVTYERFLEVHEGWVRSEDRDSLSIYE